jgi:hypothetical protein
VAENRSQDSEFRSQELQMQSRPAMIHAFDRVRRWELAIIEKAIIRESIL